MPCVTSLVSFYQPELNFDLMDRPLLGKYSHLLNAGLICSSFGAIRFAQNNQSFVYSALF